MILLHAPGTLLSPWNKKLYTPFYFYVKTSGSPTVPPSENLAIEYLTLKEIIEKKNIAMPEKKATLELKKLEVI